MIGGIDPDDGTTLSDAVTACQTALASLQRLGASDRADTLLADAESTSTYTVLDADTEHNADWLRSQYARKYTSVLTALAGKLTAAANLASTQDRDDASRVYGVKGLAGDPAVLAQYRGAVADRVADIDLVARPDQLGDLLANAVRNGDDVLAHAIAEAAIKSGDVDTTNAFAAAYPDLAAAVERLWTAEHRKMTGLDITMAWRVAALKPSALGAMQNYEIQAAAAGQTTPGAPTLRG